MKLRTAVIAGGLGLVALGGVAFAYVPDMRQGITERASAFQLAGHGHHHGKMMRHVCSDRRDDGVEAVITFGDTFLDFTPEQKGAWDQLTVALREASTSVGQSCEQHGHLRQDRSLPGQLAFTEAAMTTGVEVLGIVRPAFDAWHATLDDRQRAALDDLSRKFRRGHRR